MPEREIRIISDFSCQPLVGYLRNGLRDLGFKIVADPFDQVYQSIQQLGSGGSWASVVWTLPERVIPSFGKALSLQEVDHEVILNEVEDYGNLLAQAAAESLLLIPSWVLPGTYPGYGMLDWRPGVGIRNLLARMNLRLAETLANVPGTFILDSQSWLERGTGSWSSKLWFTAKMPFSTPVYRAASEHLISCVSGILGKSRRLIVLDLDNTLWGGVVGEVGWEGITLGGHDHRGEAFVAFQRRLKALANRGIALAISSKNDESVAMEAIERHPEMVLRKEDFVAWRIDWNDKAQNIAALVQEVNLGYASVVFIDDNPAERGRVADALPEVLVPEWPTDPTGYSDALDALGCFESGDLSAEDRARNKMYVANRDRDEIKRRVSSPEEWLEKLGTAVSPAPLQSANVNRVVQLINKTNQLNLSTRRFSQSELEAWLDRPERFLISARVSDAFGDIGLVGVVMGEAIADQGVVTDFLLSCRAMGRGVEETMLHLASVKLRDMGARTMELRYIQTDRNRPTVTVLEESALTDLGGGAFSWSLDEPYPRPGTITLAQSDSQA